MFRCITFRRVSSLLVAFGLGLGLSLGGCAAEPGDASAADEAQVDEVSSALPLEAVSMNGANFGTLQLGVGVGVGAIGTSASIGSGAAIDTGTVGTSITSGSSLGTGPIGFSSLVLVLVRLGANRLQLVVRHGPDRVQFLVLVRHGPDRLQQVVRHGAGCLQLGRRTSINRRPEGRQ